MVGQRLVVDWHSKVGRFGHHDEHSIFVCGVGAARQPSCVGPLVIEQARHIDRCGKAADCTDRGTSSVWFHCRAAIRGDVVEVTRDPSKIELEPDSDPEPPRPDACDALPVFGTHALTF